MKIQRLLWKEFQKDSWLDQWIANYSEAPHLNPALAEFHGQDFIHISIGLTLIKHVINITMKNLGSE